MAFASSRSSTASPASLSDPQSLMKYIAGLGPNQSYSGPAHLAGGMGGGGGAASPFNYTPGGGNQSMLGTRQATSPYRIQQSTDNSALVGAATNLYKFGQLRGDLLGMYNQTQGPFNPYQITPEYQNRPTISQERPIDAQRQQETINNLRAQNAQTAASNMASAQQRAGGMGLSANSPLMAGLQARQNASRMSADTQGEYQFRGQAADINSQYALQAQKARSEQADQAAQERLGYAGINANLYNQQYANRNDQQARLWAALAGLA